MNANHTIIQIADFIKDSRAFDYDEIYKIRQQMISDMWATDNQFNQPKYNRISELYSDNCLKLNKKYLLFYDKK